MNTLAYHPRGEPQAAPRLPIPWRERARLDTLARRDGIDPSTHERAYQESSARVTGASDVLQATVANGGAGAAAVGGIFAWRASRARRAADATKTVIAEWQSIANVTRTENAELRTRTATAENLAAQASARADSVSHDLALLHIRTDECEVKRAESDAKVAELSTVVEELSAKVARLHPSKG